MKTSDFYFDLPLELIARYPLPVRSQSRLLHLEPQQKQFHHRSFTDLVKLIAPGDLLVFNDTRVIPARLLGKKETGGKVEVLIERILNKQQALAHIRSSKSPKVGARLCLENNVWVSVTARHDTLFELEFEPKYEVLEWLNQYGHMPLPPYMEREDETSDRERYQTVYGKHEGAVAAPTAGLHFDAKVLAALKEKGVQFAYVTLHVGAGTFQPVRVEQIESHKMHSEYAIVSAETVAAIQATKARGGRVIAVGTTAVRSLETAAQRSQLDHALIEPFEGDTNIFIYPGYEFKAVDALLTNFHLPESTLIMLVAAFAGYQFTLDAYQEAVSQNYRFFSYGDAMFIGATNKDNQDL